MFGRDRKKGGKSGSRLPQVKGGTVGPVPSLELGESERTVVEGAINELWVEMSRRRLLTDDGIDEQIMLMQDSAESLVGHITAARQKIPPDSPLHEPLEAQVDALNSFRTFSDRDPNWTFDKYRDALMHLREDLQAEVGTVNAMLPLRNGTRLFNKIDPQAAHFGPITSPMGPDGSGPPVVDEP